MIFYLEIEIPVEGETGCYPGKDANTICYDIVDAK